MRRIATISAIFLLTGCSLGDLHALKEKNPEATDFSSSLAAEYMAYADSESDQGHIFSSGYFAHKGLSALKGENVEPDQPDSMLADPVKKQLGTSRDLLMTLLDEDMQRDAPQKAARAQLLFDCWNHQRGSDMAQAPCQDEFQLAISELQEIAETLENGQQTTHHIPFAAGSTTLGPVGQKMVKDIAASLPGMAKYRIDLTGYDGTNKAAQKLVDKRLASVRTALIGHGIAGDRIKIITRDTSKEVYLSSDEVSTDETSVGKNQVKVTVVTFDVTSVGDAPSRGKK